MRTKELRFILEGIRDGRLNHKQESYHCGTAHCVAGWKVVMDGCKKENVKFAGSFEFTEKTLPKTYYVFTRPHIDEWCYAETEWDLTEEQSDKLFDSDATSKEQFEVLEELEKEDEKRLESLDELTAQAQELDMGYDLRTV